MARGRGPGVSRSAKISPFARVSAQSDVDISSAPAADDAVWDGETIATGDPVFLGRQDVATETGLYTYRGEGVAMVRHSKLRSGADFYDGITVQVGQGTADKDTSWRLLTDRPAAGYRIGTTSLTWRRETSEGSAAASVRLIANADSPYTQVDTDQTLVADCSDGGITVNLLALASATGDLFVSRSDASSNTLTLNASGAETIMGAGTFSGISDQYASIILRPDSARGVWLVF